MTNKLRWVCLFALVTVGACGGGDAGSASATPPMGLSYSSPQTYYVGAAIQALTPTVSGSVTSYSVSPSLPTGLSLNASTGVISGTPTAATAAMAYTVTAQNSAGRSTFGLSIAVYGASVSLLSGDIARSVVIGTPISVRVSVKANGSIPGNLYATAADPTGTFLSGVAVTAGTGGTCSLELTTSTAASEGTHSGSVTVSFCQDATCQTPSALPPIAVPFTVSVMVPGLAWPGNHLTALGAWPGVADWTTFQGNAAHTGYVPVTLSPDSFSTRWLKAAAAPAPPTAWHYPLLNSVTTSGGRIYSGEAKKLLARSETDGSIVWQYDFSSADDPATNPPAVGGNVVYMAAGNQASSYFFGFDAASGSVLFKSPMSSQWQHYLAPTIGASGVYTNGGRDGGLYNFDAQGNQLFFITWGELLDLWTPAVDATAVYAYTDGLMRVVDPATGGVLHSIADPYFVEEGGEIGGSPVLGAPGTVFVANYTRAVYGPAWFTNQLLAFDVPGNSIRWMMSGDYVSTPAYHAGVVYAPNISPMRLEARAELYGGLLWSWTPPLAGETMFVSEVLLTDTLVFVCTNVALYAIDLESHKTAWSFPISGRLALSAQGVLYVAAEDRLAAFNVK